MNILSPQIAKRKVERISLAYESNPSLSKPLHKNRNSYSEMKKNKMAR